MCEDHQRWRLHIATGIIFLILGVVSCHDSSTLPPNHRDTISNSADLKMEARINDFDPELNYPSSKSDFLSPTKNPMVSPSNLTEPLSATPMKDIDKGAKAPENKGWKGFTITPKDSYLNALRHSHTSKDPHEGVVHADVKPKFSRILRREYSPGPVYRPQTEYGIPKDPSLSYGVPKDPNLGYGTPNNIADGFSQTPSTSFALPVQSSGNFNGQISYGTPVQGYGTPSKGYGPPSAPHGVYGTPGGGYLPPPQQGEARAYPSPVYGAPYALTDFAHLPSIPTIDFTWPFALKLNAFTLAKILLKLVIFKMIVKFIAVICLLLFIPKLEVVKKGNNGDAEGEEDESRFFIPSKFPFFAIGNSTMERLDILASMVTNSIEKYERMNKNGTSSGDCSSFGCRIQSALLDGESWSDYLRLFKSYVKEEKLTEESENAENEVQRQ
ncbi:uncharacterized protein LOC105704301 [Orussus abietinus]|uniref:uncharacterized protein LOC105704301 n=1 Tax=Orussus abietinus TaxID=222816 RepID=UPI0006253C21|nr:uncharacterized protein LOC105704301 [Orussus abietinus]